MEVAVMLKQRVTRHTDEQGRRLETLALRWGGNLEEVAHDTHPLHCYTAEPYRTQVRNLMARLVG
jgi:hypothetical protein